MTFKEHVTDAIRYWEPRRFVYNAVLAVIVLVYFLTADPEVRRNVLDINLALVVVLLAVLANVAYCAAYVVDIFAQWSGYRDWWVRHRWILFGVGLMFAAILTRFWSMAFFQHE